MKNCIQQKVMFQGRATSVQPRSNVWRYRLDNRTHTLTGYNIFLTGIADGEEQEFSVAVSEKQQKKYKFHIGDEISGTAWTKKYPEWSESEIPLRKFLLWTEELLIVQDGKTKNSTG